MISIDIKGIQSIQKRFKTEINVQQQNALTRLNSIVPTLPFVKSELEYLAKVITIFQSPDLLTQPPEKLGKLIKLIGPSPTRHLKDLIVEALGYKGLRSVFYPKYFREIGIKACVYCNSQLTITIAKSRSKTKARFDVDHYYPKDDYPFLAICLFNLYPVCAPCNRAKSTKKVDFDLYIDNPKSNSNYKFKLDKASKARYLNSFNSEDIKIEFVDQKAPPGYKSLQEAFSIQEIHDTQLDIVEELIIKSKMYNDSNRQQLRDSFLKITFNDKLFERVIVGNYVEEKDIHKRPFSKMMMDIARDLGIIK